MNIGGQYGASIGLPHVKYVDNSNLLNLKQYYGRSDK